MSTTRDPHDLPLFNWRPSPKVVPFPLVRRRALVNRTAWNVAWRGVELGARDPAATGEKLLAASLRAQRDTMERRGIDPAVIEHELRQYEAAVRCAAAQLAASGDPA